MEYDHMIEAFATNGANHPLDVGSLPRRARCRQDFANAHVSHVFSEVIAKDRIVVAQEVAQELGKGNCLAQLLTLLCPTSMPSLRSSPWMRGAPQPGFSRHILRIRSRTSLEMTGRPGFPQRTGWSATLTLPDYGRVARDPPRDRQKR